MAAEPVRAGPRTERRRADAPCTADRPRRRADHGRHRPRPRRPASSTRCRARATTGLLWLLLGSTRAARKGDPAIALRLGALLGAESLLTNGVIKLAFRRVRPQEHFTHDEALPYGMRRPITSSFPSGHAATAFMAAGLLSKGTPPRARVLHARRARGLQPRPRADAPSRRRRRRCRPRRCARRDRAPLREADS